MLRPAGDRADGRGFGTQVSHDALGRGMIRNAASETATGLIPGIMVIGSKVLTRAAAGIDKDKNIASGWTAHYRLAIIWRVERL
jgi:hypothetical protein